MIYIYIKFYEWIKFFSKKASFFWPIIHHRFAGRVLFTQARSLESGS